jgi:hypothetical protein
LLVLAALVPLPPRDLNVTGSGEGTVSLEWRAPVDMRGSHLLNYKIYYQKYETLKADPAVVWLPSGGLEVGASETTHTVTGLQAGDEYRLRIVAENIRGESEPSSSVTQYASSVVTTLVALSEVQGSRTLTGLTLKW